MPSGSRSWSDGLPSSRTDAGVLDPDVGEVIGPPSQRVTVGNCEGEVIERFGGRVALPRIGAAGQHDDDMAGPVLQRDVPAVVGRRSSARRPGPSCTSRSSRSTSLTMSWMCEKPSRGVSMADAKRTHAGGVIAPVPGRVLRRWRTARTSPASGSTSPTSTDRSSSTRTRSVSRRRRRSTSASCTRCSWAATTTAAPILLVKHADRTDAPTTGQRVREDRARDRRRRRAVRARDEPGRRVGDGAVRDRAATR